MSKTETDISKVYNRIRLFYYSAFSDSVVPGDRAPRVWVSYDRNRLLSPLKPKSTPVLQCLPPVVACDGLGDGHRPSAVAWSTARGLDGSELCQNKVKKKLKSCVHNIVKNGWNLYMRRSLRVGIRRDWSATTCYWVLCCVSATTLVRRRVQRGAALWSRIKLHSSFLSVWPNPLGTAVLVVC